MVGEALAGLSSLLTGRALPGLKLLTAFTILLLMLGFVFGPPVDFEVRDFPFSMPDKPDKLPAPPANWLVVGFFMVVETSFAI